uniref:Small ribosomal subunit protein uS14c n=2 Tax=Anthoceros TaxID=3233 RepID=A0A6M8B0V1_ANTPU|nr:ribosomal protein S14 [Anthoceros punctatus]YP_009863052.1 ribosomal protein S14 [Anthoceros agrestis]QKD76418.1 ribosomal protein S14 [Anthoceros punctatus]QKD76508.1 ribosomal protein S14 [Anthoceros agrestis]
MAKKSLIQREKKREKSKQKYQAFRKYLKEEMSETLSIDKKWEIQKQLQSLPRNSTPTCIHRRCFLTGRPRANYRDFNLSRHIPREMIHACLLFGVTKASW